MKRLAILIAFIIFGFVMVGFRSRPYSDLAEYKRLPISKRIARMQKIGEDFFLRRKYETAIQVFKDIQALDKKNMKAMLWITKARQKLMLEKNELTKKQLYKKFGQLTPKELIYHNWTWGPTVGAFKVRYSKPKPYVPPVRKVHPRASDKDIAEMVAKAKSGKAADLFELAMRYWSRKETNKAIDAMSKAVKADRKILENDDELLLATAENNLDKKIAENKASPSDLLARGKLAMLQGDTQTGIKILSSAARKYPKFKHDVEPFLLEQVKIYQNTNKIIPADIFSFRQAYVFEENESRIYVSTTLLPKPGSYIVPLDITVPMTAIKSIKTASKDVLFAYAMKSSNEMTTRLWVVLGTKEDKYANYDVKLIITLNTEKEDYIELSNFNLASNQPDNWSFVIGPEVSFGSDFQKGEIDQVKDGIKVSGFQLGLYDGKGPFIPTSDFKVNPLPRKINVWKIMQDQISGNI